MKTFYQLLGNSIISNITNMTVWFALVFFSYLQTQSVLATSISSGIFLVATAISSFWFGSLVDHNKKKTVILVSTIFSLIIYIIGFAIYVIAGADAFKDISSPILWSFVTLLLLGVTAGGIRFIALPTIVTIMVEEENRDKANGLVGMSMGIAFLVVSSISAILVGYSGMYHVLILAIVVSVISIAHLWTIDIPEKEIVHLEGDQAAHGKIDVKGTLKAIKLVPGLGALILFTTFNNFLGGVFMALMDAYGLSLVSVQTWGIIFSVLSTAFIVGGIMISKYGLGKNPLNALFKANVVIWVVSCLFTIQPSIWLMAVGMFIYLCVVPYIEAAETTIIQKVVPLQRQGRVLGFAHSIEQAASPLTAFLIGPITQAIFIPFMTTGAGVELIGDWFGTGSARGIALVFTLTGIIGLCVTLIAMRSKPYQILGNMYMNPENKA